MGRPIQKKFMTAREGSVDGDLQLNTSAGIEPIIQQKGTSLYKVASGNVRLVDEANQLNLTAGQASITHNGKTVRKISQYRISYFDNTSDVWRDKDGNTIGTFVPALSAEVAGLSTPTPPPVEQEPVVDEIDEMPEDDKDYKDY